MSSDPTFDDLASRLQDGDPDAPAEVFSRFSHRLISMARRMLGGSLRSKVDPEDLVQSAMRSFFVRLAKGDFTLMDWGSLWGLLTIITTRKCDKLSRRFQTESRSVQREVPLSAMDEGDQGWKPAERIPNLHEAVELADMIEQLMSELGPHNTEILLWSMEGRTPGEIALRVGRSERTIQRVLERIRELAQRKFAKELSAED